VEKFGRLDVAFNNAGIEGAGAPSPNNPKKTGQHHRHQSQGVWLCLKYEIQQMLKQGGGELSSTWRPSRASSVPRGSHYCASKHGVMALTKSAPSKPREAAFG